MPQEVCRTEVLEVLEGSSDESLLDLNLLEQVDLQASLLQLPLGDLRDSFLFVKATVYRLSGDDDSAELVTPPLGGCILEKRELSMSHARPLTIRLVQEESRTASSPTGVLTLGLVAISSAALSRMRDAFFPRPGHARYNSTRTCHNLTQTLTSWLITWVRFSRPGVSERLVPYAEAAYCFPGLNGTLLCVEQLTASRYDPPPACGRSPQLTGCPQVLSVGPAGDDESAAGGAAAYAAQSRRRAAEEVRRTQPRACRCHSNNKNILYF